jgi:hypothetical protein
MRLEELEAASAKLRNENAILKQLEYADGVAMFREGDRIIVGVDVAGFEPLPPVKPVLGARSRLSPLAAVERLS